MSTETTNKKIKIDNGTTFGRTYTDKAVDERLQGLVSTATFTPVKEKAENSLQKPAGLTKTELVGVGANGQENIEIGDNLTLANGKLSATGGGIPVVDGIITGQSGSFLNSTVSITIPNAQTENFILHIIQEGDNIFFLINNNFGEYNATVDNSYDSNTLIHNIMIISGSGTSIKIQQIAITNNYFINGSIDSTNKITIPDKPISPFFCQIINGDGELYKMYQVYTDPSTGISYGYGEFDVDSNSFTYITNKGQATLYEFKEYKIVIPKVV